LEIISGASIVYPFFYYWFGPTMDTSNIVAKENYKVFDWG
jgi:hypothetical protein